MMHIYVINLDRAPQRLRAMEQQMAALGLPFTVCPAIDGRTLDDDELARVYDAGEAASRFRPMSNGEIGCALSHLQVYRRMLADGASHALVLEDDAALGADLPATLADIEKNVSADESVAVLLSYVEKYSRWGTIDLSGGRRLVKRYSHWWRAHGYVVTRAAAERMAGALYPVRCVADFWWDFEKRGIVGVRAVVPYCVSLTDLSSDSSLGDRITLDAEDKARRSVRYYLHRYVYRRFLHQIFVRPFMRVAKQKRHG